MAVRIENVSPRSAKDDEEHEYVLRFNNEPELVRFRHVRSKGLAECLRAAADAVEREIENRDDGPGLGCSR